MYRSFLVAALAATLSVFALIAGPAFAANPQGQVEQGNGRSICRFSGLNDNPNEPFPENGQVQSFGQLVKKLGPMGGVPGIECNPNKGADLHPRP